MFNVNWYSIIIYQFSGIPYNCTILKGKTCIFVERFDMFGREIYWKKNPTYYSNA